jgi:transcriptional regulator with XRE-family HTH domain
MKTAQRDQARSMRREQGLTIKEIAERLGVAKSSVSRWVRDVDLTAAQHEALRLRNPAYNHQMNGALAQAEAARWRRAETQKAGRARAQAGDPTFVLGCMLYWAEGDKARNAVRFTNSDPDMVRFFVSFLRKCFDVPSEKIRVRCYLYPDHRCDQERIEEFWLDLLDLARISLCRSTVNSYSRASKRKRKGLLPYGTCLVTVNDTSIAQQIYGAIQEIGGFERDAWLE